MPPRPKLLFALLALLLFGPNAVFSQNPDPMEAEVKALFDAPDKIQWVKYYDGRFDDTYGVRMALGFDGDFCRGWLEYYDSGLKLKLDGTLLGPVLRLKELDELGKPSGYLHGKIEGKKLTADWINHNNSLGSGVEMQEVEAGIKVQTFCGDGKWMHRYSGTSKYGDVELVLVKLQGDIALASLWYGGDNRSYDLRGTLKPDGKITLESELDDAKIKQWVEGQLASESVKASWTSSNGDIQSISLELKESLTLGCLAAADFLSSYDILYPQTANASANEKLAGVARLWEGRCKEAIASKRLTPIPANRNVLRASMWPEISCWSEDLLSGYLNYTDSWSGPAKGQAFNVNLKTGQMIRLEDLFQKSFDYDKWMNSYMRKESPKNPQFANDPKFREWLYEKGYTLFTIRRDGLKMSTLFHPIYGQQHLLISWTDLQPYLKPDAPVADLIPKPKEK
jgi:hypothetical protein